MNLFDLVAKITLDTKDYEDKVKKSGDSAKGLGSKIGGAFSALGKVTLAGLGAAAAGVGTLVKSAVSSYADYEQLVGGVETLFKGSSALVQEYAANAYKTAGLSANQYMETVTSFSASLLQSLGGDTEKAAKIGDMAITDMSDNANKMGSSMESIQMAYQGFAKQNYTMLDNLKLGYGGTKTEMERLLKDATAISGVKYDISSLSDVYEAIHVIQGELDITGTTAKEASTTISGSVSSMKSAWQNLLTGIADDNADFGKLIDNFVDSVGTAGKNILPRISTALQGVGKIVTGLAPMISTALPTLVSDVVPSLISAAGTLLQSFSDAILQNLPTIISAAVPVVLALAEGLVENLPLIVDAAIQVILALSNGLIQALPDLVPTIVNVVIAIMQTIISNLPMIIAAGMQVLLALGQGILNSVGQLIAPAAQAVAIFASGIASRFGEIINKGREIVGKVGQGIRNALSQAANWGRELISNFISGIKNAWESLKGGVTGIAGKIAGVFKHSVPKEGAFKRDDLWGEHLIENFTGGMLRKAPELYNAADSIAESVRDSMNIGNVSYSMSGTSRNSGGGLAAEIAALREDVRNMKIYLDTGVLVGTVDSGFYERESGMMRRAFA